MTKEQYFHNLNKQNIDVEILHKILDAQEKYKHNQWWLSEIPEVIGYFQLFEPTMLVSFSKFHEGIEKFLGRSVWTHEFGLCYEELKHQVEKIKNGENIDTSLAIANSFKTLENFCLENDIELLGARV